MGAKFSCPKCGGYSWLEKAENGDIFHKCFCGYLKVVERITEEGMIIYTSIVPKVKSDLPRRGTKLSKCLAMFINGKLNEKLRISKCYSTAEVAEYMNQSTSTTAANLTALRVKGLLEQVARKRGVSGGSMWKLSFYGKKLLMDDKV